MKFLEAKKLPKPDKGENKMQPGTRPDQRGVKAEAPVAKPAKKEVQEYADSLGIDLAKAKGTGRDGEVTMRDVKAAKDATNAAFRDQ